MEFYSLKLIRKGIKPPVWRRAYIPAGLSFSQLAVILEKILEYKETDAYQFDFFRKYRIMEIPENPDRKMFTEKYYYTYMHAPDNYINDIFITNHRFVFRILEENNDNPEYTAEVESMVELGTIKGTDTIVEFPLICKGVTARDDKYWSDIQKINNSFEKNFRIKSGKIGHLNFYEVSESISKNQKLIIEKNPKSTDKRTVYSTSRELMKTANLLNDYIEKRTYEFNSANSIDTVLEIMAKEYVMTLAESVNFRLKSVNKSELHELGEYLLKPEIMKMHLLLYNDKVLDYLERLTTEEYIEYTESDDVLSEILGAGYLICYESGIMKAVNNAEKVFKELCSNGYREYHKKSCWMIVCIEVACLIYKVLSLSVLHEMFCRNEEFICDYNDFCMLFNEINDFHKYMGTMNDIIYDINLKKNNSYKTVIDSQKNIAYYVPHLKEIRTLKKNGYPVYEDSYKCYKKFLINDVKLSENLSEIVCIDTYAAIVEENNNMQSVIDVMIRHDILLNSKSQVEKYMKILRNLMNNTPRVFLRGNKPVNVLNSELSSGMMDTEAIIPVSFDPCELT